MVRSGPIRRDILGANGAARPRQTTGSVVSASAASARSPLFVVFTDDMPQHPLQNQKRPILGQNGVSADRRWHRQ